MNLRRHLSALLLMLPIAAFAVPYAATTENEILPGRDYIVLATPLPTSTGKRIEVREFFFYGCSHCFALEPAVDKWLRSKPGDVELVRTPAVLNPKWGPLGRAYYVAEELQVLSKIHSQIFDAIHVKNEQLVDQASIGKFFERTIGVPKAEFDAAWNSFPVNTQVKNADALARKYMVSGTPTVTVAGKYVVPAAGERTFAIVDFLVAKERAAFARKK